MHILLRRDIGIYRKIPLKNSITRLDGTKSKNNAKITNISVSDNYTTYIEKGYKIIKIGDNDKTLTGRRSYIIKYTYDIGKDPLKNADELYYNLIGDEWDTSISNVTFKITMPKSFDKSLLGFSSGYKGSTNNSNIFYTVNGNVITGSLNNTLNVGEALTVRLTLPEGYFVNAKTNVDGYHIAIIIFSLVCVLIADRLWAKYGKDEEVIETVEFYPPEGYNSAEVGFLYDGVAETKGVISLLIYLASKGYIKIEETDQKGQFTKSNVFKITKLKEYDGNNEVEKIFFNGLFKKSSKADMKKVEELAKQKGKEITLSQAMEQVTNASKNISVTSDYLYNHFYRTLNKIKNKLNRDGNKNKIFESSSRGKRKWFIVMIILIFILIMLEPIVEGISSENINYTFRFPIIIFVALLSYENEDKKVKIFRFFGILGCIAIFQLGFVLPILIYNTLGLITYLIGIICIATIMLFMKIMPKRTPFGNEILGKIRGFKRFLETAEKPQLEALVMKNPEYFYDILPYTYALGVSNVWMKKFETIAMQPPDWYSLFSMYSFCDFMNSVTKTTQRAASSGGGGSSGGGSSGGGSGGGGRRFLVKRTSIKNFYIINIFFKIKKYMNNFIENEL